VPRLMALLIPVLLLLVLTTCSAPPQAPAVSSIEPEKYAADARWAPGQLEAHFQKHPEGYRTVQEYDRGARDTILKGNEFTYLDRESSQRHLGFYEKDTNRFTALTLDGGRITTHFRPDQEERCVRQLPESTYR
jgi:hypothetical protein